jgi:hypothetical protein
MKAEFICGFLLLTLDSDQRKGIYPSINPEGENPLAVLHL